MSDPPHRVFPWVGWNLVASGDDKLSVWRKVIPSFFILLIARRVRATHGDPMPRSVPILRLALWKLLPNHLARRRISSRPKAKDNQEISR